MIDIDDQEEDRKRYSDKIINSPAKKKIIVAGTGKTIMGCTPLHCLTVADVRRL